MVSTRLFFCACEVAVASVLMDETMFAASEHRECQKRVIVQINLP